MREEIVAATNALEGFATYVEGFWTDQPFHTALGNPWNAPPLSREDLSSRSRRLAQRVKALQDGDITGELKRKIEALPQQISWFQANTLPQLANSNNPQVVTNFDIIMSNVEEALPLPKPAPSWEEVEGSSLIPTKLSRRIRNLEAGLARIEPRASDLDTKIKSIEEAHTAASDLPTDLLALKEARDEVTLFREEAKVAAREAKELLEHAIESHKSISENARAADQILVKIDQAYSAATSAGLAGAFKKRADQLSITTWVWVLFLVIGLSAGGAIGYYRLQSFQELITTPKTSAQWIWLEAAMSFLAIAAPVWFAWLSTRQIGQRFKLAEDYGFKAAVAQAYEGYRKEAARLDPQLEARLFASALDRLEEQPSRFLPHIDHNSPYEALLESAGFQRALERLPQLREVMQDVLNKVPGGLTTRQSSRTNVGDTEVKEAD